MDPLAGCNHSTARRIVETPDRIAEDTCRIDHDFRAKRPFLLAFQISGVDSNDPPLFLDQPDDGEIVETNSSLVCSRPGQYAGEARIVELPVVIDASSFQAFRFE